MSTLRYVNGVDDGSHVAYALLGVRKIKVNIPRFYKDALLKKSAEKRSSAMDG